MGRLFKPLQDNEVTAAKIADGAVGASKLGQSGNAPVYGCRAWVSFNGITPTTIFGAGNVASITDYGVGLYGVNFTTAMPDAGYATVGISGGTAAGNSNVFVSGHDVSAPTASAFRVRVAAHDNTNADREYVQLAVFR